MILIFRKNHMILFYQPSSAAAGEPRAGGLPPSLLSLLLLPPHPSAPAIKNSPKQGHMRLWENYSAPLGKALRSSQHRKPDDNLM
jgi:hypothetical protein